MAKHPHFANALRDLKGRYGATAADLTPDELFELAECAGRAEAPFAEVNADAVGFPVKVREGLYFWRLTAGAGAWLDEYAAKWWGDGAGGRRYFWALCYALANARSREAFVGLDTPASAHAEIRKFILGCGATEEELARAADKALGRAPDPDDPRGKRLPREGGVDWSRIVARLEGQSGIPASEWLWGRSASYAVRAYNDLRAFAERYCSATGESSEHLPDLLDRAFAALARTVARIGRRVAADRAGTAGGAR